MKQTKTKKQRVLVIGDVHAPFTRKGYLEHCKNVYKSFNCDSVVFIGDIIDNCFSSFHTIDPDGYGAGDEFQRAYDEVRKWYKAFPKAKVCLGNHDLIIERKNKASGVSKHWTKSLPEALDTPNWDFDIEHEIDGVVYTHGTNSSGPQAALKKALHMRQPVVQGHIHTEATIMYSASNKDLVWGMIVGCGIDDKSYAMAYAKDNAKKSIISCGIVLEGELPILIPMKLV